MRPQSSLPVVLALLASAAISSSAHASAAELGMGFKVGEVTQHSAVVWTRITAETTRRADGSVPGAAGEVRVRYGLAANFVDARATPWTAVDPAGDYIHQFRLTDLQPGSRYHLVVEARPPGGEAPTARLTGGFGTPAPPDVWQDVSFAVITGQAYKDLDDPAGFHIYPAMQRLGIDFLVPTGDTVYYDNDPPLANTVELMRLHWQRMYSLPRHIEFHRAVPGYWEVDDHDSYVNDCWPGLRSRLMAPLTFEEGYARFREQVPLADLPTHRTIRWGRGLQIWLVEGRLHRSPNNAPDGPDKSLWGSAQREWLMQSLLDSDADFKVLISPTPIVGPDRGNKADNHANRAFAWEGNLFRRWTAEQQLTNLFVCCGDRHWQYLSIDPETRLHEFSCGPASDQHAGGSPGQDPAVQPFHRVQGGFLEVSVRREQDRPTIVFRHRDVTGHVQHEFRQTR